MKWFKQSYSRLLIDSHITDISPEFMSRFDPAEYVRLIELSGVDSAMVYACCHNGNCYYPTKVGHMHKNLCGRDILGEVVSLLNQRNIVPIAYYTLIYHNHSAISNPAWRTVDAAGSEHGGRYHFSCPNNPEYVEFVKQQLTEITAYDIAGLFLDMTYWPKICQCSACKAKYYTETARDIPQIIDWNNPEWVNFQRARERWMAEFAQTITDHIKSAKNISVTHQFSPVLHGWMLGQSSGIAKASDYSSGDFYGGKYQQRIGTKVFAAYSRNMPYEFMTSCSVNLKDHTSMKSEDELFLHAGTTLANAGAYLFIDGINPDGTLVESTYKALNRINKRLKVFRDCIKDHRPELIADCGLYFSMASCVELTLKPAELKNLNSRVSNMAVSRNVLVEELTGTAAVLCKMKIPYRVITDADKDLSQLKTLIINNASYMSAEEVKRIKDFVKNGGTLIATGMTSYYDCQGKTNGDFQLNDIFGVSFSGTYSEDISYLEGQDSRLVSSSGQAPLINVTGAELRGTVVQPHFPCDHPERYASIHSNPPGVKTDYAGLAVNSYGKGRCVYIYSSLLKHRQHSQETFGIELFKEFIAPTIINAESLAECIEVTFLKSTIDDKLIVGLVNYQDELPNIPVIDLHLEVYMPENIVPEKMTRVSSGENIVFACLNGVVSFKLSRLDDLELIEITPKLSRSCHLL